MLLSFSSVIQNPYQASDGENVTVCCALFVSNDSERFTSIEIFFIIGDINDFIPKYIIDSNITYNGIDLSRFIANAPLGNSNNVNGSITLLSYNSSTDKDLRMGCYNKVRPIGASMSHSFNQTLRLIGMLVFVYSSRYLVDVMCFVLKDVSIY